MGNQFTKNFSKLNMEKENEISIEKGISAHPTNKKPSQVILRGF